PEEPRPTPAPPPRKPNSGAMPALATPSPAETRPHSRSLPVVAARAPSRPLAAVPEPERAPSRPALPPAPAREESRAPSRRTALVTAMLAGAGVGALPLVAGAKLVAVPTMKVTNLGPGERLYVAGVRVEASGRKLKY